MRKVQYEQELGRALRDLDYDECPPNGMGMGVGVGIDIMEVTVTAKDDGFIVIQGFAFGPEERQALDKIADLPFDFEKPPGFDAKALVGSGMTTALHERKILTIVSKSKSGNHIFTLTSHGLNILHHYRRATRGIV